MNTFDVIRVIKWTRSFDANLTRTDDGCDRDLSPRELRHAAKRCQEGYDPWEAAAECNKMVEDAGVEQNPTR